MRAVPYQVGVVDMHPSRDMIVGVGQMENTPAN
jgi:hypothetical protein